MNIARDAGTNTNRQLMFEEVDQGVVEGRNNSDEQKLDTFVQRIFFVEPRQKAYLDSPQCKCFALFGD